MPQVQFDLEEASYDEKKFCERKWVTLQDAKYNRKFLCRFHNVTVFYLIFQTTETILCSMCFNTIYSSAGSCSHYARQSARFYIYNSRNKSASRNSQKVRGLIASREKSNSCCRKFFAKKF